MQELRGRGEGGDGVLGRAPDCKSRLHQFEPHRDDLDHLLTQLYIVVVRELIAKILRHMLTIEFILYPNSRCFANKPINACQAPSRPRLCPSPYWAVYFVH